HSLVGGTDRDFHGEMDEVRVWNYQRSEEEIRRDMFSRLRGDEQGLVGLWNFDDGTAHDSSPGGHHGKMAGASRAIQAELPSPAELLPWARISMDIRDASGTPLRDIAVIGELSGAESIRASLGPLSYSTTLPDAQGGNVFVPGLDVYSITVWTN